MATKITDEMREEVRDIFKLFAKKDETTIEKILLSAGSEILTTLEKIDFSSTSIDGPSLFILFLTTCLGLDNKYSENEKQVTLRMLKSFFGTSFKMDEYERRIKQGPTETEIYQTNKFVDLIGKLDKKTKLNFVTFCCGIIASDKEMTKEEEDFLCLLIL